MCPLSIYTGHPPTERQKILNRLPARYQDDRPPLPCQARVVWEHDGEEWIAGEATRWDPADGAIFVQTRDPRNQHTGVWLEPSDIRLAAPAHT